MKILPTYFQRCLTILCVCFFVFCCGCASWPGMTVHLDMASGPRLEIDFGMTPSLVATNHPAPTNALGNSPTPLRTNTS